MDPRRPIFLTLGGFFAATTIGCGAATYNEGDNDNQPPVNECAELDGDRPDDCED